MPGGSPQKVQELKPEYLGALAAVFGDAKMPPICEVNRSWPETKATLGELLPRAGEPVEKSPLADPRARTFADLYFRSGHSIAECQRLTGEGRGGVHGLNLSIQNQIADAFGITVREAGELLLHYRVDQTCELWRPWHASMQGWIAGGFKPKDYTVNFHDSLFEAATLFERLNLPWRYLGRETSGPLTLKPTRNYDSAIPEKDQPFVLEVWEGEQRINAYCLADPAGKLFTPRIANWRALLGPAGHFTRLLVGDGPVCLQTALAPRPVRVLESGAHPSKVAFLLSEGRSDTGTTVYLPTEYGGEFIKPHIPVSAVRSGRPCQSFSVSGYHELERGEKLLIPLAEYSVQAADVTVQRVSIAQHLGHLADWDKAGARQHDAVAAKRWLAGESSVIPRLEPLRITDYEIFEDGKPTGRTRKAVNFLKQKIPVPKSYEGTHVLPVLTEVDGLRFLELHPSPAEQPSRILKTFQLIEGRALVSSPYGGRISA